MTLVALPSIEFPKSESSEPVPSSHDVSLTVGLTLDLTISVDGAAISRELTVTDAIDQASTKAVKCKSDRQKKYETKKREANEERIYVPKELSRLAKQIGWPEIINRVQLANMEIPQPAPKYRWFHEMRGRIRSFFYKVVSRISKAIEKLPKPQS